MNNDLSHGPTERSGTVVLTPGTHSIEIRYFQQLGGSSLEVSVSGPDTGDVKTALFDSALTPHPVATVESRSARSTTPPS